MTLLENECGNNKLFRSIMCYYVAVFHVWRACARVSIIMEQRYSIMSSNTDAHADQIARYERGKAQTQ